MSMMYKAIRENEIGRLNKLIKKSVDEEFWHSESHAKQMIVTKALRERRHKLQKELEDEDV